MSDRDPIATQEPTTGELLRQLSEDTQRLVRDELDLAKVEMTTKAKKAGIGAGLFGGAGLLGLYGFGTLLATVILALALVMDAWLAALIVTVVLFVAAGIAALVGKKNVDEGVPPKPERTMASVKKDVEEVKEARHGHQ